MCWFCQELPSPVPVRTRLPAELFGEALMVLEFLQAFGEVYDLKDEFPDGVSLGQNALSQNLTRTLWFLTRFCSQSGSLWYWSCASMMYGTVV